MIEKQHYDEAEQLMALRDVPHSDAFLDGERHALAWCFAGKPKPTPENNRETDCPYDMGTAERDAWQNGWANGHATAIRMRIVKSPGLVSCLQVSRGRYVEVSEPELGIFDWQLTDVEGEVYAEGKSYSVKWRAIRDALNAVDE